MERKLWFVDTMLILYFIFLTYLIKPYWCIKKGDLMVKDCSEDIYGNFYNLRLSFSYTSTHSFALCVGIMIYFNIKYFVVYSVLKQTNNNLLESNRKLKLVLASILNILHFLFYFLAKDNIIIRDGC